MMVLPIAITVGQVEDTSFLNCENMTLWKQVLYCKLHSMIPLQDSDKEASLYIYEGGSTKRCKVFMLSVC